MNTGLIMILLGGFFGIIGIICLIMGIRSGRRTKNENYTQDYNNSNYNSKPNQMNYQNNGMNDRDFNNTNSGNGSLDNGNMGEDDFDPFNENGGVKQKRVRNEEFDPFSDNPTPQTKPNSKPTAPKMPKMPTMEDYDRDDFDPFANTKRDINKGVKPVKQSFNMPKVPDFSMDSELDTKVKASDFDNGMGYDDGDFDAGMGFEAMQPKNNNLIDMDEDLEDF